VLRGGYEAGVARPTACRAPVRVADHPTADKGVPVGNTGLEHVEVAGGQLLWRSWVDRSHQAEAACDRQGIVSELGAQFDENTVGAKKCRSAPTNGDRGRGVPVAVPWVLAVIATPD